MEFKDVMSKLKIMCNTMHSCDECPLEETDTEDGYGVCGFRHTSCDKPQMSPEDIEKAVDSWYRSKEDKDLDRIACSDNESVKFNITKDECCKLILAISKYERALNGVNDIASEDTILYAAQNLIEALGDVKLMVEQLTRILDCRDQVEESMKYKIASQLKRLERENNLGDK